MEAPELQFVVREEAEGGYSAHCKLPGNALFTQGDDLDQLHRNVLEVAMLYLETFADDEGTGASTAPQLSLLFSDSQA